MVKIYDKEGKFAFSLTSKELKVIKRIRQRIYKDNNQVIGAFFGDEGCGKTIKSMHWAYAVDPSIDMSRVDFDVDEFIKAIHDNKKASIIADEAIAIFFNRAAMTKDARLIQTVMAQIRKKNHCMFLNVPDVLTLDKLIIPKLNFVCRVYESTKIIDGKRVTFKGNVEVYRRGRRWDNVRALVQYLNLKRRGMPCKKPRPDFTVPGRAVTQVPWMPVDRVEYERKKDRPIEDVVEKREEEKKPKLKVDPVEREKSIVNREKAALVRGLSRVMKGLRNNGKLKVKDIAEWTGYTREHIGMLINDKLESLKVKDDLAREVPYRPSEASADAIFKKSLKTVNFSKKKAKTASDGV